MHFRKILCLCLIGLFAQAALGQTLLSSQHLELKRSEYYHQVLAAPSDDYQQMVVFAADRDSLHLLRYNSVLFCTDSLMAPRPDNDYDIMAGYSFSGFKSGNIYWSSFDYKKIMAVHYDFDAKTTIGYYWQLAFDNEDIISTFSENNTFYIVTLPEKTNALKFYAFKNDKYEIHTASFEGIALKDENGSAQTINKMLESHPLQKIERFAFTPLSDTAPKSKLYAFERQFMLTLDANPAYTQVITVDTDKYKVSAQNFPQPEMEDETDSNSFYYGQRLYQFTLNKEEMALQAADIVTGKLIKQYRAGREDEDVSFKNSPLYAQADNRPPDEFRNTKSFLRRANRGNVAISVYQTPDDIMVTAGSIRTYVPAGEVILGAGITMAGADPGGYNTEIETMYFESLFNHDFTHKDVQSGRLAIDYISQYLYENSRGDISLETVMPFTYYYILGYYDTRQNRYIIRKFEDDYYEY